MNIILLTTKLTITYTIEKFQKFQKYKSYNEKKINFGFKIKHKLYDKRDKYEKKFFFSKQKYF